MLVLCHWLHVFESLQSIVFFKGEPAGATASTPKGLSAPAPLAISALS